MNSLIQLTLFLFHFALVLPFSACYGNDVDFEKLQFLEIEVKKSNRKKVREVLIDQGFNILDNTNLKRGERYKIPEKLGKVGIFSDCLYFYTEFLPKSLELDQVVSDEDDLINLGYKFAHSEKESMFDKAVNLVKAKYGLWHNKVDDLNEWFSEYVSWEFNDGTRIEVLKSKKTEDVFLDFTNVERESLYAKLKKKTEEGVY